MLIRDDHALSQMRRTANKFSRLAALRGITADIDISSDGHYVANGIDCGCSVHGLYDWLNRQPGVLP